jgi:hypothetical protein
MTVQPVYKTRVAIVTVGLCERASHKNSTYVVRVICY